MYPRQSAYPTQPVDTGVTQQYPQAVPPQPAATMVPLSIQFNEEEKALLRRNGIKMIVVYVIGIVSFTVGLPILINGVVQTVVGNFTGALSAVFIAVGSILMLLSVCMLVIGLILLGKVRAEEAEIKAKRDERMRSQQQATQFQTVYSNSDGLPGK